MGPKINPSDLFRSIPAPSAPPPRPKSDNAQIGFKDYLDALQSPARAANRRPVSTAPPSRPADAAPAKRQQDADATASSGQKMTPSELRGPNEAHTPWDHTVQQSNPDVPGEEIASHEADTLSGQSIDVDLASSGHPFATMLFVVAETPAGDGTQDGVNGNARLVNDTPTAMSISVAEPSAYTETNTSPGEIRHLKGSHPIDMPITGEPIKQSAPTFPPVPGISESMVRLKPADRPDYTTALLPEGEPIKIPYNDARYRTSNNPIQSPTMTSSTEVPVAPVDVDDAGPRTSSRESTNTPETITQRKMSVVETRTPGHDARGEYADQDSAKDGRSPSFNPPGRKTARDIAGTPKVTDRATINESMNVTIQSATGDAVAARLAHLLVKEDAELTTQFGDPSIETASTHVASARSHSGSTPVIRGVGQGSVATTVGELLTSQTLDNMPSDVVARLLNKSLGQGRHQATLRLDPPELGQMRIDIRVSAQGMLMRVDVEHAAAAKLIESRMGDLREALAGHGIRVERAEVIVRPPETDTQGGPSDQSRHGRSDVNDSGRHGAGASDHGWRDSSNTSGRQQEAAASMNTFNIAEETTRPIDNEWDNDSPRRTRSPVNLVA